MATILVVEDDRRIAELVERRLKRLGHSALLAHSAEAAFQLAAAQPPELILLDIVLGETSADGWEVNRRLKGNPATRHIPVIALTGAAVLDGDKARALEEGFAGHLGKPIESEQLADTVRACLLLAPLSEGCHG